MVRECVYRFPISREKEIRFSFITYQETLFFDVRTYALRENEKFRRTKQGFLLSAGHLGQFLKGIKSLGVWLLPQGKERKTWT